MDDTLLERIFRTIGGERARDQLRSARILLSKEPRSISDFLAASEEIAKAEVTVLTHAASKIGIMEEESDPTVPPVTPATGGCEVRRK